MCGDVRTAGQALQAAPHVRAVGAKDGRYFGHIDLKRNKPRRLILVTAPPDARKLCLMDVAAAGSHDHGGHFASPKALFEAGDAGGRERHGAQIDAALLAMLDEAGEQAGNVSTSTSSASEERSVMQRAANARLYRSPCDRRPAARLPPAR
jgi:hypothetical protein